MFHTRDIDFRYGDAMKHQIALIALLLTLCIPVAAQTPVQLTPEEQALMEAAYMGKLDEVRRLVLDGTPVDAIDAEGRTPLMFAAFNGHAAVAEYLLDAGAEIDTKDSSGRTALMYAASGPFVETVGLLLKRGAEVNVQGTLEGFTPLMTAAAEGLTEVVRILLAAGADRDIKDVDGDTALSFARQNGHGEVVELLEPER
jgi:ankyrin repeat protein